MSKNEKNDLLVEIVRKKVPLNLNELKNNCFYLASKSVTAAELAEVFGKSTNEVVAFFWQRGQTISKNQIISSDSLADYCKSLGITIKRKSGVDFREIIQEYLEKLTTDSQLVERPPIVSIMGHIDHGKTTLLDTIRQTNVQKKEIGRITQKITISQVEFNEKRITFLDTPGHSDFIKMRQRGISLTDIVVLVIDASDGLMSQTTEIINYLQQYQIPVIIFINHKKLSETNNEVNLNRIRTQLQEKGLTPLEWGGEAIVISGSSRENESTNYLLENISLLADFKTNLQHPGNGLVIDSYLHSRASSRVTELLVRGGKIQEKDSVFLNGKFGKIKMLYDLYSNKIVSASAGDVIKVVGINFPTELGDRFLVVNNESAKETIEKQLSNYLEKSDKLIPPSITEERKNINLILLADSQNTLEALNDLVEKKDSSDCRFSVVYSAIGGNLNNYAINLAKITQSIVLAFGLQLSQEIKQALRGDNIPLFCSKIIYEIEGKLMEIINSQQEVEEVEEKTGVAQVKQIFYFSKLGNIAGCQVIEGKINRNNSVHVLRGKEETKIFTGKIKSLESNKLDKSEVVSGHECGIVLKGFDDFQERDKIIAFRIVKQNVIQK